jgi:hypothetical protein
MAVYMAVYDSVLPWGQFPQVVPPFCFPQVPSVVIPPAGLVGAVVADALVEELAVQPERQPVPLKYVSNHEKVRR